MQKVQGNTLPSGERLHSNGKSPFLMGKSTISMAILMVLFGVLILKDPEIPIPPTPTPLRVAQLVIGGQGQEFTRPPLLHFSSHFLLQKKKYGNNHHSQCLTMFDASTKWTIVDPNSQSQPEFESNLLALTMATDGTRRTWQVWCRSLQPESNPTLRC